jgi:hypothetical protein
MGFSLGSYQLGGGGGTFHGLQETDSGADLCQGRPGDRFLERTQGKIRKGEALQCSPGLGSPVNPFGDIPNLDHR